MENTIDIKDLSFSFNKGKPILKDLTIKVPKGSIFGFLGANGAGKSTTMRFIIGALTDTDKTIRIFGQDLETFYPDGFKRIGSLIDYPAFYDHLSGWDNLMVLSQIRQLPKKCRRSFTSCRFMGSPKYQNEKIFPGDETTACYCHVTSWKSGASDSG